MSEFFPPRNGRKVIGFLFRAWITHWLTGQRLYAKDYGKRAFRIPVYA